MGPVTIIPVGTFMAGQVDVVSACPVGRLKELSTSFCNKNVIAPIFELISTKVSFKSGFSGSSRGVLSNGSVCSLSLDIFILNKKHGTVKKTCYCSRPAVHFSR